MQPYSMGNLPAYVDDSYSGRFSTTTILTPWFYAVNPYTSIFTKSPQTMGTSLIGLHIEILLAALRRL